MTFIALPRLQAKMTHTSLQYFFNFGAGGSLPDLK